MNWIPVGRVTKVHGLKGELKLYPSMDVIWIADTKQIRLSRSNPAQEFAEYIIQSIRGNGTPLFIKFNNIDSIDAAKELVGQTLYILRERFPDLPDDEYYWFQIKGLRVFDEDGNYYGNIEEIIQTGSNDVYVVRDDEKELLLPMIDSVVKKIDLKSKELIFHPMEGLLEDTPV